MTKEPRAVSARPTRSLTRRSTGDGCVLQVSHVTKRYRDNAVVDDLSFVVPPGRVTAFLGPNGSGKSTTMKIMLDLAAADAGNCTIGGRRYRDLDDPARTVGAILESDAFHPGRSGRNHLRILADATGVDLTRVDDMLEQVGLTDAANRRAGAYSLGMRQRLGLAAALLGQPEVLILDEPGNGLDPQGTRAPTDQQSLIALASNGFTLAALFGAIAVSREYGHHTVIPTFLASPRRRRAVGAQLGAVAVGGGVLSLVGTALTVGAVALALPTTDYGFLISVEDVVQVLGAAAFAGAAGAVLGAGIGAIVRSIGGAVTGTTLALIIVPPLIVQLASETASWMPNILANVLAGVGTDVSTLTALGALATWAVIPATIGLIAVERRDIV